MGKISTRELFDRFYNESGYPQSSIANIKNTVDVPILYEYEEKIGKELVDMDMDEILYLIRALIIKSLDPDSKTPIRYYSYKHTRTFLIAICEWYSLNVEPIKIWLRSPELRGDRGLEKLLSISAKPITWQDLQNVFDKIRKDYSSDRADYTELVSRLFYCGVYQTSEIVNLKERDINFRSRLVTLPGRIIKIDEKTNMLLQANHEANQFMGARQRSYSMRSWRDSYMHFVVDSSHAESFDKRSEKEVCITLNKLMTEFIRNNYDLKITFKDVYWLGFYDYIVKKCGQSHADEIIMSSRNVDAINELLGYASGFGVSADFSAAEIKSRLRMFVSVGN